MLALRGTTIRDIDPPFLNSPSLLGSQTWAVGGSIISPFLRQRSRFPLGPRCLAHLAFLLLVAACVTAQMTVNSAQLKLPETPVREVTDTYFGTKIADPYRWLEDLKSPDVISWMKTQSDYTRAVLDRVSNRDRLRARIAQLDDAGVLVNGLQSYHGRWFYLKGAPGDDTRKLYVRDRSGGSERLLLNPETLTANGVHYSIDYFQASPDGKLIAVGISPGGSENSVMHVLEADTGRDTGELIDRAQFSDIYWLPDSRSFFYNRLHKYPPSEPRTSRYLNSRDYIHHLGDDPEKDVAVFGKGLSPHVSVTDSDVPFILRAPGSNYVFGVIAHGVQNETSLYVALLDQVHDASVPWRKLIDVKDDVTSFDVHGDNVYLLSHHNASRYKVLRIVLPKGEVTQAEVAVPPSDAVITAIAAADDGLYLQKSDGGIHRLWRLPYEGGAPTQIDLPFDGTIEEMFANPAESGVYIRSSSWTKSPVYLHYDPKANSVTDTKIIPPSPVDFSAITSEEVKAKATDDTLVPLSIIHRRDLKLDRSHPTLLHGYGSYAISYDPKL